MLAACGQVRSGFAVTLSILVFCALCLLCFSARAAGDVDLSAETDRPSTSTYSVGEPAAITFSVSHLAPRHASTLSVSLLNEFGKPISAPVSKKLIADALGNANSRISVPTSKLGYYEVHAHLTDGTTLPALGTRPSGFITYTVVPDPARRVDYGDVDSRFGMQGGFSAPANVIFYLGARYILQNGAGWAALEPHYPGEYSAQRKLAAQKGSFLPAPDAIVHSPQYNGKTWTTYYLTTLTNASLPAWAVKAGTTGKICNAFGAVNASAMRHLSEFAAAVAEGFYADYHAQTKRYYQVTWEPAADWCFRGTPADLVQIYSLVYAAIHKADPGAVVAGPTLFADSGPSMAQLKELWKAGLGHYIDAFSLHPYTDWPPEKEGVFLNTLRQQLKDAREAVGHPISFIGTEHGYKSALIGNLQKALGDIRSTILILGEGADYDFGFYLADFWVGSDPAKSDGYGYYWNLNPRIIYGTDKIGPKAVVPAYAAMTYFLDGSVSDGPLDKLRAGQIGYRFHRRDKSTIVAIWAPDQSSPYTVGPGSFICDWMGNCSNRTSADSTITIGQAPTYIVNANP